MYNFNVCICTYIESKNVLYGARFDISSNNVNN